MRDHMQGDKKGVLDICIASLELGGGSLVERYQMKICEWTHSLKGPVFLTG